MLQYFRYICSDQNHLYRTVTVEPDCLKCEDKHNVSETSYSDRVSSDRIPINSFTELKPIRKDDDAREQWSSKLGMPDAFWTKPGIHLNGYFGSLTSPYNQTKSLNRYSMSWKAYSSEILADYGSNKAPSFVSLSR
jgi:hypothetical protein